MSEHWNKDSLDLKVGDQIIWQDAEIKPQGGPALVSPGMKGEVLSLHEAAHLDMIQGGLTCPQERVHPLS